ncbi:hypothetical protein [Chitinophaga rhizosphaerae]|uniref:hypothetical protein n=1 Tax=Chitinophaga rhizosphaerae TaxID=1864947 RepID=UPI000F804D0F|nr:hypothetical protein [Chitinophaga rhizosphaerae]
MHSLIVDKDPHRRRIARGSLKMFNPTMQIIETDSVFNAKKVGGFAFTPNFLIIDMELTGAKSYVEQKIMDYRSTIPQIYAFETNNKKGVSQQLMADRFCLFREKGYLDQIPAMYAPSKDGEPPRRLFKEEAEAAGDPYSFNLIKVIDWNEISACFTAEIFYEIIKEGYQWRGSAVQNTPYN